MDTPIKHGDFTQLADAYAKYRPGYAPFVLEAFLKIAGNTPSILHCADVGAGTGIWSRTLAQRGVSVIAVEPNAAMRTQGEKQNGSLDIAWREGCAENTGLPTGSCDLVTMASSFHWPDFAKAVAEFKRILKPGGLFMALWNTRHYESNPLLVDIEQKLYRLIPDLKRVSSGRSQFCGGLLDRLKNTGVFADVIALEGRHTEVQTPERYIGLWESVNDVRVQAGEERFARFLEYIRKTLQGREYIEAEYATLAWIARKE